jgi:hypothetical protein
MARITRGTTSSLPDKIGKFSKKVDTALPGKHTRQLYDQQKWKGATALSQMRTGVIRLNSYLFPIKAAPSAQCDCGEERETVEQHSLMTRTKRFTEVAQNTDSQRTAHWQLLLRVKKWRYLYKQWEDEIARTRQENDRLHLEVQHCTGIIKNITSALDEIFAEFLSTRRQSHFLAASKLKDIIKLYRSLMGK